MARASADGDAMGRANSANRQQNRLDRDKLEGAPGYLSSGEGQWSVRAASGGKVETRSIADTRTMTRLELLIHRNVKELINFEERASRSRDPAEVTRLLANIQKKRRFIDTLRREQRDGRR